MDEQQIITRARELTEEFLAQLGLDAEISIQFSETDSKEGVEIRYLSVKLDGEHLAELIGFHGKVFDSVQTILGLMLSRQLAEPNVRTLIEINDYRQKREEYLKRYAERAAEEVRLTGQPMELPPMKPFERRIIHMVLKNDGEVGTESEGEGDDRRIKIVPKM